MNPMLNLQKYFVLKLCESYNRQYFKNDDRHLEQSCHVTCMDMAIITI